jgi:hypothetical protein
MRILAIGTGLTCPSLQIVHTTEKDLLSQPNIQDFDYLLIGGGDGTLRRILGALKQLQNIPPIILDPTGSFNVIAKLHNVLPAEKILDKLAAGEKVTTKKQRIYRLNEEIFLFSAGNMGDLQHIFFSETLRFGILRKGVAKYLLATLFLLPAHVILTPFMLMSKSRFFIFTPFSLIKKFGSFYGVIDNDMAIDLQSTFNYLELDGDIVMIQESILHISPLREIDIITA